MLAGSVDVDYLFDFYLFSLVYDEMPLVYKVLIFSFFLTANVEYECTIYYENHIRLTVRKGISVNYLLDI